MTISGEDSLTQFRHSPANPRLAVHRRKCWLQFSHFSFGPCDFFKRHSENPSTTPPLPFWAVKHSDKHTHSKKEWARHYILFYTVTRPHINTIDTCTIIISEILSIIPESASVKSSFFCNSIARWHAAGLKVSHSQAHTQPLPPRTAPRVSRVPRNNLSSWSINFSLNRPEYGQEVFPHSLLP